MKLSQVTATPTAPGKKTPLRPMTGKVRKYLMALFVLSMVSAVSYGQKLPFHFGLKAGANLEKVTGRSFDGKTKAGFSGGAYAEIKLSRQWYVQPELLFNQVVTKTNDQINTLLGGVSYTNVNLNYITLPVMIAFKPVPELSILLGGQYGYLVNQTADLLQSGNNRGQDAFKKSDIAIVFGGQLNLGKVKIGARYVIGVNEINSISTDAWKYHGFQFHLGYQLF